MIDNKAMTKNTTDVSTAYHIASQIAVDQLRPLTTPGPDRQRFDNYVKTYVLDPEIRYSDRFDLEVRNTFHVGCTLYVRFEIDSARTDWKSNQMIIKPVVQVAWSSFSGDVSTALAAATLHRKVLETAAQVESALKDLGTISKQMKNTEEAK